VCAKQHSASIESSIKERFLIKVSELNIAEKTILFFLDAREPKEYKVSHIQDAILVGFNYFNSKKVEAVVKDKNTNITLAHENAQRH
jgi:rhodanese-related sulfurtransferase